VGNHLYTTDVGALRMGFDLELMLMMLQLAKSFLKEAELGMEAHSAEKLHCGPSRVGTSCTHRSVPWKGVCSCPSEVG
jgi:hypothetical protein